MFLKYQNGSVHNSTLNIVQEPSLIDLEAGSHVADYGILQQLAELHVRHAPNSVGASTTVR